MNLKVQNQTSSKVKVKVGGFRLTKQPHNVRVMARPATISFNFFVFLVTSAGVCRCEQSTFQLFSDQPDHQHQLTVVARTNDPATANFDVLSYCRTMCELGRGGNLCRCNAAFFTGKRSPPPTWNAVSTPGDVIRGDGCVNGCNSAPAPSTKNFAAAANREMADTSTRSSAKRKAKVDKHKRKMEVSRIVELAGY
jgi:hypothetical protein